MADDDPGRDRHPLAGTVRGQYGGLMRAMASIGYTPDIVKGMDVWEAADALGVGDEGRDPAPVGSRGIVLKSDSGDGDGPAGWDRARQTALDRATADPSLSGSSLDGSDW